jgi:hypothetical protein
MASPGLDPRRRPLGLAGVVIYRPLVRATLLTFAPTSEGGRASYVSTGLLRTRLSAPHNGHVDLRDGQVGTILSTHPDSRGRFVVHVGPHLWWWWPALVAACFLPALWTVVFGEAREADVAPPAETAAGQAPA